MFLPAGAVEATALPPASRRRAFAPWPLSTGQGSIQSSRRPYVLAPSAHRRTFLLLPMSRLYAAPPLVLPPSCRRESRTRANAPLCRRLFFAVCAARLKWAVPSTYFPALPRTHRVHRVQALHVLHRVTGQELVGQREPVKVSRVEYLTARRGWIAALQAAAIIVSSPSIYL